MAKLTITILLFFFFICSYARDLTDRSENVVSIPVEDSDSKAASIFLPSEKFTAPESISDLDQVRTESNPSEINVVDTTETGSDSNPLVVITFRRVNRQFERRSVPLMFRRSRRGCHHRHSFKPWRLIDNVGEVSYGDDMLISDEKSNPNSGENWGSDRKIAIPERMNQFRHVGPWESFIIDLKEERKRLHHFHHHHHGEEEKSDEHEEKSGFVKNFRKFLNQFQF